MMGGRTVKMSLFICITVLVYIIPLQIDLASGISLLFCLPGYPNILSFCFYTEHACLLGHEIDRLVLLQKARYVLMESGAKTQYKPISMKYIKINMNRNMNINVKRMSTDAAGI